MLDKCRTWYTLPRRCGLVAQEWVAGRPLAALHPYTEQVTLAPYPVLYRGAFVYPGQEERRHNVFKYSLQQYVYDGMRVNWLKQELAALEGEFKHCTWAGPRMRNVLADLMATTSRMRNYERLPQNRGGK